MLIFLKIFMPMTTGIPITTNSTLQYSEFLLPLWKGLMKHKQDESLKDTTSSRQDTACSVQ
jgi:hypothetical protein